MLMQIDLIERWVFEMKLEWFGSFIPIIPFSPSLATMVYTNPFMTECIEILYFLIKIYLNFLEWLMQADDAGDVGDGEFCQAAVESVKWRKRLEEGSILFE